MELSKQYISLTKIIERNKRLTEEEKRLNLPFILIKFQPKSDVSIVQDDPLQYMELTSSNEFELMTEIHLFEGMGLTRVNYQKFLEDKFPSKSQYRELKLFALNHWK